MSHSFLQHNADHGLCAEPDSLEWIILSHPKEWQTKAAKDPMMAGHDNSDSNHREEGRPLGQHLVLGLIETLLNSFIELDEATRHQVAALSGLIVRVKLVDPYQAFYLYFTPEGIEVLDVAPGPARVRVNAKVYDLMRTLLGSSNQTPSGRPRVKVWGEAESVAALEHLLTEYNVRTRARQWLHEHLDINNLWERIRRHDPSWLQDFLPLPGMMRDALSELRQLNHNLQRHQEELETFRQRINRQRKQDLLLMVVAFLAILGGLTGGFSSASLASLTPERILLLVTALTLIVSRLRDRP